MPIHVALPLPRLDPLTYGVPEGTVVGEGYRVLVPLGSRIVTGTVVAVDQPAVPSMRTIEEVLDEQPSFSPEMLSLTRRVAEYYLCAWGEVLHAALPAGLSPSTVVRVRVTREVTDSDVATLAIRAPKRARLLDVLRRHDGEITVAYLQKRLDGVPIADQLDALQRTGWIEIETSIESQRAPRMVRAAAPSPLLLENEHELRRAFDLLDAKAPKQSLALGQIYLATQQNGQPVPVSRLSSDLRIPLSSIDALERRGLITITTVVRTSAEDDDGGLVHRDEAAVPLTAEQQAAVDRIEAAVDAGGLRTIVLHGVTGSGKTIVYQRAIANVLSRGKRALVMVPEISLTPQLADRFRAVFGDKVAVLHSRLAVGERIGLWQRIRDGAVDVVIGPRSAVFAPLTDVGLIVVDEEHEPSYKQEDPAPRYHGRDVAILRAQRHSCPIVLGSATPSLETLALVDQGRAEILRLTHRADAAVLPTITITDLREERKARRMIGALAMSTVDAIVERIGRSEGTLVFLNRRGYAVHLQCDDCGDVPMCRNCDVALTYHKAQNVLRCHYCGFTEVAHAACTVCGSLEVRESGTGTQRVEEDLRGALTERLTSVPRIERLDADTTARKGEHRSILRRFSRGEIDVLVGTQMIAKGLDIPRVTLVVVVNADMSLHQTDFRASERTVQLLTQVAGRAGRSGDRPGTMIVQTSSPDHPAIVASLRGERDPAALRAWEQEEMRLRAEVQYPPHSRFIVIEVRSLEEHLAENHIRILAALLPPRTDYMVRLEPVTPPIGRIRNQYRRLIVIKNIKSTDPSGGMCRSLLRNAFATYHAQYSSSGVHVTVDVDAYGTV